MEVCYGIAIDSLTIVVVKIYRIDVETLHATSLQVWTILTNNRIFSSKRRDVACNVSTGMNDRERGRFFHPNVETLHATSLQVWTIVNADGFFIPS